MRRPRVQPRRVVFIGVEGRSERAFVKFMGDICEEMGLHVHPRVKTGSGGDSLAIVEEAARHLGRQPWRRDISDRLVLLDQDRIVTDQSAGRDALASAGKHGLRIVLMTPNLEGLLLRLHRGREQTKPVATSTQRELRKVWPTYRKPPAARELRRRFGLADLRRAAAHDPNLRTLMEVLGLWSDPPPS